MIDNKEVKDFDETFNKILSALLAEKSSDELTEVTNWVKECIKYNVPHGKRNRGLTVVTTFRIIAEQQNNNNVSEDDIELARVLGWCVEFLQAYFLVVDDMMDQSITRRGQLCWYKLDYVGLMACNDAILIDQENYHILKLFFKNKNYYLKLVDLFHEISRYTSYGQCLDTASKPPNKSPQFASFSQTRYKNIVKYKTSYYSFVLPVRLAMYMSGVDDEDEHKNAEEILLKIGHMFQVQDDYLDCYGDSAIIGKIGTDIEEGKCCWPIIKAFEVSNEKQMATIKENYGIKDGDCVQKVKEIYNELNIKDLYHKEEEMQYKDICKLIDEMKTKSQLNSNIFTDFLAKIYKRQK
ncbi:uncharacterized protein LOC128963085 [Oppia nitens]|uniref:uncharacterized protein LOC128963085 n=1 Tax=Oppia nitens TaxID=1686743 RepID=UPI0023DC0FAD|nr:uncharacterized protein LOC128963085 [Oppia nitens]XP_054165528.1 uncharacterized protein LOC128963085 [Oppia nitens]XP_054165529.1 uncharacterized protein LOC128963085 [Oppia nitens]XP_054165530.1 uncharacterized protein LOC128963085 [Oppia nitens]